jgi:anaerobic magnesium-protoporphyrin IX monomethyl ester cyclase
MRLLFINCVSDTDFTYSMPLAVSYLTGYLKGKFNEKIYVKAISINDTEKIFSIVKSFKPDILGLTTTSPGYDMAKTIAKQVKKINKKIIIVAGGSHITLFNDSLIPEIDYAVMGEGEKAFYELIKFLYPKKAKDKQIIHEKDIAGLIYWDKKVLKMNQRGEFIKNLDEVGHPDRRLLNPTNNMLFTSRGCPFNCIYCSSPIIWKRSFRMHSAEYVFEEIKTLYENKHSVIWFGDDLFTVNKDRIRKIIELLRNANLLGKISFMALGRSEMFDDEMAKLLKELNVLEVQFGFETGDDKILKRIKNSQNISVEKNKNAFRICKRHGLLVTAGIMIGFPEEGHKEIMKTYNFFKKYNDYMDRPAVIMVFPGTQLQEELKKSTGKDYAKIHMEKIRLTFGGLMPVTEETSISQKLTPEEIKNYREMFHRAGIIKNKIHYIQLFSKLLFSKGVILNMYYLYNIFMTMRRNPKREYNSPTIVI